MKQFYTSHIMARVRGGSISVSTCNVLVNKAASVQVWFDEMSVEELDWPPRALILIPSKIFGMSWNAD